MQNIIIGVALIAGGALLTALTYGVSGGSFIVAFYGAILVGIIQFVWGLIKFIIYSAKSPGRKIEEHIKADIRLLLRSMIAAAAADGKLERSEITIIKLVSAAVLGDELSTNQIRDAYGMMRDKDYLEEIACFGRENTREGAELAVKSMVMVALADGDFSENEEKIIVSVAVRLGVEGESLRNCFDEAREMIRGLLQSETKIPNDPNIKDDDGHREMSADEIRKQLG